MPQGQRLKHVAIIMDGNGRWATGRSKPRTFGHVAGARKANEILTHMVLRQLHTATLWGFSSENWKRPDNEVNALMGLFQKFAVREVGKLDKANIRVTFVGRRSGLSEGLQRVMQQVEERTVHNTGLHLRPAINFSALQEFVDAANRLTHRGEPITDEAVRQEICGGGPGYDLVIRTGGESRTSDFPIGHGELSVTNTLWPDFTTAEFDHMCADFASRERRFGGLSAQTST